MQISKTVAVGLGICLTWVLSDIAQAQVRTDTICRPQNTFEQSNQRIIGRPTGNHYVVVVLPSRSSTFDVVRQCVQDAFYSRSRLGSYIHAGTFQQRSEATQLATLLRARGLDARVEFFR